MTIQLGDIKLSASMGPTYVYFRLVFYDPRALIHSHMQLLLPRLPMPKARDLIFKKKNVFIWVHQVLTEAYGT